MIVPVLSPAQLQSPAPTEPPGVQDKIGSQDYPPNPALDEWAKTAEYPTVPKFFRMAVAKNPDGPYVGAKVGKTYEYRTYKEIESQVEQLASGLIQAGIKSGERVGIFAENSPNWRVTDLGVAYAGGILTCLLAEYPDRTMQYVLKDSCSKMVVVDTKERLEQILRAEPNLPDLQTIIVSGDADLSTVKSTKKLIGWKDFMASGASHLDANRPELEQRIQNQRYSDIGSIVYTSGSTGDPKGVLLSHGNVLSSVESVLRRVDDNPDETLKSARHDDVYPSILPLGHVMGRVADYAITAEGGKIAYPAGLIAFRHDLKDLKPTVIGVTPLFFNKIYEGVEKKALHKTGLAVPPLVAGLVAGTAGMSVGALGGTIAGAVLGGAGLAWALGIAGGVLFGATADTIATKAAGRLTKADAFQKAIATSKKYYQSHGRASVKTRIGHWLGKKSVFSTARKQMDEGLGNQMRVMMSGGAPLSAEAETLFRAAGYHIAQGYGLTETSAGALMNNPERAQLGTVGPPLPGMQVRLSDAQEIQVRAPSVMTGGYLNKNDATRNTFTDDGWFRTGDTGKVVHVSTATSPWKVGALTAGIGSAAGAVVGSVTGHPVVGAVACGVVSGLIALGSAAFRSARDAGEDDYVISGRIKSQFKLPGGEYVTPEPIEEDLKGSPYIADAVVVGAKDHDMVGALIVPKFDNLKLWAKDNGLPTDPVEMAKRPEVIELLKAEAAARSANHARHEVVRTVAVLDHEFSGDEVTATNKVKRPVVLERYSQLIESMFQKQGDAP